MNLNKYSRFNKYSFSGAPLNSFISYFEPALYNLTEVIIFIFLSKCNILIIYKRSITNPMSRSALYPYQTNHNHVADRGKLFSKFNKIQQTKNLADTTQHMFSIFSKASHKYPEPFFFGRTQNYIYVFKRLCSSSKNICRLAHSWKGGAGSEA